MKYAPQKGNEKMVLDVNSRIRFSIYELSIGTPYYQGGRWFKGCDQVLVLKEPKQNQWETFVTQSPKEAAVSEFCELSPDCPDFSPDSPGVRSIRTSFPEYPGTFQPTAIFQSEEYKYTSYPLTYSLSLAHFESDQVLTLEQLSHSLPLIFERFLEGFKWETCKRRDSS